MSNWASGVGPGWKTLVEELVALCEQQGVEIEQVKEKFGGLRFYVGFAPQEVFDAIQKAENRSYSICEECGAPGKVRIDGWMKTLCEVHGAGRPTE